MHYIKSPNTYIAKAIEYINANYRDEISLNGICKAANMSKSYFCREFKRRMGMTVMEYVLDTRIAAAKVLLNSGELTVSQISDKCGFSSPSYFCQVFKEKVGITAKRYIASIE